jgi:hypothetical protein
MVKAARRRASERNLPFSITTADIKIPEFCPVLGIKLEIGTGYKGNPASPSLDRIIPEIGYTPENVQVISVRANSMKRDASPAELRKFCAYYLNVLGTGVE